MLLAKVARASDAVAATASRTAKIQLLASIVAADGPDDTDLAVRYLSGELRQRRTGVGMAALRDLPPPAEAASLTLAEVDQAFAAMSALSGAGSAARRRDAVAALFAAATDSEQRLLVGLVSGELHQGAAAGLMVDAVAVAAGLSAADVRGAVTVAGSLPAVARVVVQQGASGLSRFRLQVGRPLAPMLAQSATSVGAALDRVAPVEPAGVEWKLDGIRLQAHRDGDEVSLFSRTGDDLTARLPDVVAQVRSFPVRTAIVDGEALVLRPDGTPAPFQLTGSRVGTRDAHQAQRIAPLSLMTFDVVHLDGDDLLAQPARARWDRLATAVPPAAQVPRLVTAEHESAQRFVDDALRLGHEGVVVKAASAPYAAGRRGAAWVKVKPRIVLDLVVVAVEWGHGRRTGRLSNLHLGAYDPEGTYGEPGGFVMLGKTFKGMTDAMLEWQTQRFLSLALGDSATSTVSVRPAQVVEIAIDGVQASQRYPAGVALRFARVLRYREDKKPTEADTVAHVRALLR